MILLLTLNIFHTFFIIFFVDFKQGHNSWDFIELFCLQNFCVTVSYLSIHISSCIIFFVFTKKERNQLKIKTNKQTKSKVTTFIGHICEVLTLWKEGRYMQKFNFIVFEDIRVIWKKNLAAHSSNFDKIYEIHYISCPLKLL